MATGPRTDANTVPATPGEGSPKKPERLRSIDIVRGLVMAVMALDHVRDYFLVASFNLMDPERTTVPLYFSRWITHFCAPAFFLLAGIGAYLAIARGKDLARQARFLVTRGLFLVFLDLVVIRIGWDFNFEFSGGPWFIVLSTLGFSMMILAGLIYLPYPLILLFSLIVIAGHNSFDWLDGQELGMWEPLWYFLHVRSRSSLAGISFFVSYPLLPWVGVMALGYCLGPLFTLEGTRRRRALFLLGLGMILAFVVLRASNVYGDPRPWVPRDDGILNILAFLRTKKYPASLAFLLMTLGPILMLLAVMEFAKGRFSEWLILLGRAPLFFYILHIYVIHALTVLAGVWSGFPARDLCVCYVDLPRGYNFGLGVVYGVWFFVLVVCYPACAWFDSLKRRTKSVWLSYL